MSSLVARKVKALHHYLQALSAKVHGTGSASADAVTVDLWKQTLDTLSTSPVQRSAAVYDGTQGTEGALLDKLAAFASGALPEELESRFWQTASRDYTPTRWRGRANANRSLRSSDSQPSCPRSTRPPRALSKSSSQKSPRNPRRRPAKVRNPLRRPARRSARWLSTSFEVSVAKTAPNAPPRVSSIIVYAPPLRPFSSGSRRIRANDLHLRRT